MKSARLLPLRRAIAERFPGPARQADARLEQCGFTEDAHIIWLEEFSRCTTHAIAARNEEEVKSHLTFMSAQLTRADPEVRSAIDVAYVEPLFSGLKTDRKRWAWPLLPANLKQLYLVMWGDPGF